VQCVADALELRLGGRVQQRLRERGQLADLLALVRDRGAQLVSAGPARLGVPQPLAGLEQRVQLALVVARELVDRPRRLGGLLQALDLVRAVAVAVLAQSLGEGVALGGELAQRQPVEAVDVLLGAQARKPATAAAAATVGP
jgi:hypothetical protein